MNSSKICKMLQYPFHEDLLSVTTAEVTLPTVTTTTDLSISAYSNGILYYECDDDNDAGDDDDGGGGGPSEDSFASLETISDNVSVWVDGEKHWISGVDANTTFADLISALVNYQDAEGTRTATSVHQTVLTKNDSNKNDNNNNKHITPKYVIVKQERHCEEFLDSNVKIFDILPLRGYDGRKEFELFLRRIESSSVANGKNFSFMDKDSGMGSPVGSSRSAKFRRKKHKIVNWLAQSNTLHPRSQKSSNERLMKIILAQDETIHQQLSLLRDKDHQISKIEEENHKVREKELGKNYVLETYLDGLGEQNMCEEIFIDEPFRNAKTSCDVKQKLSGINSSGSSTKNSSQAANLHQILENQNNFSDDIELKIIWMEKVITINKQLQKEEEMLLKIFSKIRKYHVKRAYITKREMMQQIMKIDSNIALQYADIKKVESSLMLSNQQLKHKLYILENISCEFQDYDAQHPSDQQLSPKSLLNDAFDIGHLAEDKPISISTAVNNLQTSDNLVKLQKLISKPQNELTFNNYLLSRDHHIESSDSATASVSLIDCESKCELVNSIRKDTKLVNVGQSITFQKQMFTAKCPLKDLSELGTLV